MRPPTHLLLGLLLLVVAAAPARGDPRLSEEAATLADSLTCTGDVRDAPRRPVLLIPGTTETPEQFSWNAMPALTAEGIPWCAVEPPGHMMRDIQANAEYVVHAIRAVYRMSGRKLDVIGHSQGGMIGRWALKFWPRTRRMVDDVVGLAPSNHGTTVAAGVCLPRCAAAVHQQRRGSRFLTALNAGAETYRGISYTNVYSIFDEVVVPPASAALTTGGGAIANVPIQSICPRSIADHVTTGTTDPAAWALAFDALTHRGPADPARVDRVVCSRLFMPGVNPLTVLVDLAETGTILVRGLLKASRIPAEPPLRDYVKIRRR